MVQGHSEIESVCSFRSYRQIKESSSDGYPLGLCAPIIVSVVLQRHSQLVGCRWSQELEVLDGASRAVEVDAYHLQERCTYRHVESLSDDRIRCSCRHDLLARRKGDAEPLQNRIKRPPFH